MSSRFVIAGVPAARGMTLGRARLVEPGQINIDERPLTEGEIEPEVEHLREALAHAREELNQLRENYTAHWRAKSASSSMPTA